MASGIKRLIDKFMRFGLVGILGTITNLIIFFIVGDLLKLNENLSAIISFAVAVTQNYMLNAIWTYSDHDQKANIKSYLHFVAVSLVGLAVNLAILNLVLHIFPDLQWKTIAQALGIGTAFVLNFLGSHFLVFRKKEEEE